MLLAKLWNEETGAIVSAEYMLVMTILVIGVIVGLKSVRDAVVTELADVAQAISNVDQSYTYSGTSGHHTATAGAYFHDLADFCDGSNTTNKCEQQSKCVAICSTPLHPICGGNADGANGNTGGGI
jgi:Flp pilus assembly pilin Flp